MVLIGFAAESRAGVDVTFSAVWIFCVVGCRELVEFQKSAGDVSRQEPLSSTGGVKRLLGRACTRSMSLTVFWHHFVGPILSPYIWCFLGVTACLGNWKYWEFKEKPGEEVLSGEAVGSYPGAGVGTLNVVTGNVVIAWIFFINCLVLFCCYAWLRFIIKLSECIVLVTATVWTSAICSVRIPLC